MKGHHSKKNFLCPPLQLGRFSIFLAGIFIDKFIGNKDLFKLGRENGNKIKTLYFQGKVL